MSDLLSPPRETDDAARLAENAALAARLLRALANERRLLVLCDLVAAGEKSVNDPKAEAVLHTLHRLFCEAPVQSGGVSSGG